MALSKQQQMDFFSSANRISILEHLQNTFFDVIIIGGGITGAGIALDAASRGMKVALLEKADFASGTSSKSTKLIHGGLRYLKQFEIGLVREVGRERAIVHQLAPHIVRPEKMLLPLIKGGTYGSITTSAGLMIYDLLAGVNGDDKRKMLNKEETLNKEPLLKTNADSLKGGGYYAEYRTDDARLTIENIKSAIQHGAVCLNYIEVESFFYEKEKVGGVKCIDVGTGNKLAIKSTYIINATGPWVDKVRKKDEAIKGKRLFLSKGIHVVVPYERFPLKQSIYFDVPDGRMIFAIPRNRVTYIGTTDTPYNGDLNNIPIYQEDVEYLLKAANNMFPVLKLSIKDVESSWAGLRPLINEEGKSASEMSRKDEIFESQTGLVSIAGGKLTGYRKMAERVLDLINRKFQKEYNKTFSNTHTHQIPLSNGAFKSSEEVKAYENNIATQLKKWQLPSYYTEYLVTNYGLQSDLILKRMQQYNDSPEIALARAEAWYSIQHELAYHPIDLLDRRSGRLYFYLPSVSTILPAILCEFKEALRLKDAQIQALKEEVELAIKQISEFHPAS